MAYNKLIRYNCHAGVSQGTLLWHWSFLLSSNASEQPKNPLDLRQASLQKQSGILYWVENRCRRDSDLRNGSVWAKLITVIEVQLVQDSTHMIWMPVVLRLDQAEHSKAYIITMSYTEGIPQPYDSGDPIFL